MIRDEFIERSKKVHGDKYIYTHVPDDFKANDDVVIICPEHGEFVQCARTHYRGHGCPKCKNEKNRNTMLLTTDIFRKKYHERFGDKYDTSLVDYKDNETDVTMICPTHGTFKKTPHELMRGEGCPMCGKERSAENKRLSREEVIERANKIHNHKYSYDKYNGEKLSEEVTITCPIHGDFRQTMRKHLMGSGCRKCGYDKLRESQRKNINNVFEDCGKVHNNKYKYVPDFEYVNNKSKLHAICPIHGEFWQEINAHLQGEGCPKCSHPVSRWETEIFEYILSLGVDCEQSNRTVLNGKEIDIYVPGFNVGIECDGLRWHSEQYKDKNYHLDKTEECERNGIRLIHVFEDEWIFKKEIWKSMFRNMFGLTDERIYARNCEIREVSPKETREFLDSNHIQGYSVSKINYGLYYNDELVSLMTFGIPRINMGGKKEDGCYELVRFCNKVNLNVVGGASKLFKHFIKANNPIEIVSYSDKRWSIGRLYEVLGFVHDHDSKPNYFYVNGFERMNRFRFRKSVLVKEGFDRDKSEHEIMTERGIYRIYDCGTKVWIWKKNI